MRKLKKTRIIAIIGPTASGKSNLGIFLARKFKGEIISADSRQIYRGLDIGTGKVNKKEQKLTKHHLLDVVNPKKVFTVSDFKKLGSKAIYDIVSHNKLPFIVGGTGFYIDALVRDVVLPEVPPNQKLRAELAKQSAEQLFSKLLALDSRRAKTVDAKNKVRLIRALEIILTTNESVPALNTNYGIRDTKYDVLWLGLKPKNLEKIIESRLEKRLRQGMVSEVRNLLSSGVSKRRLHDLGLEYRWIEKYLAGEITRPEMQRGLLRDIIKYSKRQMTWFKRNKEIHWVKNSRESERLVRKFLLS